MHEYGTYLNVVAKTGYEQDQSRLTMATSNLTKYLREWQAYHTIIYTCSTFGNQAGNLVIHMSSDWTAAFNT